MSIFKNISEINPIDAKFTENLSEIRKMLADNFATYHTYYGYDTNELSEYISDYISSDIYENPENEDECRVIYHYSPKRVIGLMNWLANWDMIYVKNNKCVIKQSNHQDVAKMLNKMLKIA